MEELLSGDSDLLEEGGNSLSARDGHAAIASAIAFV